MTRRCAIKQNGFYRLATAIKYPVSAVRRYGIFGNLFHKLKEGESGMALPATLLMLLLGSLLLTPLLGHVGNGVLAVRLQEQKARSLYTADAGVEDALWKIMKQPPGSYPYSYSLSDINGMSVNVTVEEVTDLYGVSLGEGGVHDTYLELHSERVQPPYFDSGVGDYVHEWRLQLTNKDVSNVDIDRVTVAYPSELEYLAGLYNENIGGLASGSFEDFSTDFTYQSSVTVLTWELNTPRPKMDGAPDPANGVYTTVTVTFELEGPETAGGISSYVAAARQDVGTVWEYKPFKITATASDGANTSTPVTVYIISGGGSVDVFSWQIQ